MKTPQIFRRKRKSISFGKNNVTNRKNWLESKLRNLSQGLRILDAGAGEQQYKPLCTHLEYVSQDFAEYHPEDVDLGLQMENWNYGDLDIICDIANIPEPNESFDAIMCVEVFEHIINPREAIKEFSRLMKPGGQLLLTAPFNSLTHFAPYHFYTGFNRFFYESSLTDNNFKIIEISNNGDYFEYMAQEINRLPSMASNYCQTKLDKSELNTLAKANEILEKLSKKDQKSSDLLCFGYHVLAVKL